MLLGAGWLWLARRNLRLAILASFWGAVGLSLAASLDVARAGLRDGAQVFFWKL